MNGIGPRRALDVASVDDPRLRRLITSLRLVLALGLMISLGGAPWLPLASLWFVALVATCVF